MRLLKAFVLIGIITVAGCGASTEGDGAKVQVNQTVEYYDIAGSTEAELRDQLNQKGIPVDGNTFYSVTYWNFHWDYDFDCSSSASCSIGSFTVKLDVKFVYPRWAPSADAPVELVNEWNEFMQNLMAHENGHRDLAVAAAQDLGAGALELPANNSGSLDAEVQTFTTQRITKLNADEAAYDVATMHGATQGAVFPQPFSIASGLLSGQGMLPSFQ